MKKTYQTPSMLIVRLASPELMNGASLQNGGNAKGNGIISADVRGYGYGHLHNPNVWGDDEEDDW